MILRKLFLVVALLLPMCIQAQELARDSTQVLFTRFAKNGMGAQSGDCYGDYLVTVAKLEEKFGLYNLKTKKLLNVFRQNPKMEMKAKADVYHANNSSFGTHKFIESDPFPLLYVSNRCNNASRGVLDVYRLVPMRSVGAKDYDSLTVEQVQTIYYPKATDKNALGSPWTVIDRENNYMYTYSRNNRGKASNYGVCRISKFKIPSVKSSRVVYLNDEDILESYEVDFKAPLSQGACIHHGKMYIAQGVSPKSYLWLRVVDLKERKLVKTYNLKEAGFTAEPEGCYIYDGHLMLSTGGKRIFKTNIPLE